MCIVLLAIIGSELKQKIYLDIIDFLFKVPWTQFQGSYEILDVLYFGEMIENRVCEMRGAGISSLIAVSLDFDVESLAGV